MKFLLIMFEGETDGDMIKRGIATEIEETGSGKLRVIKREGIMSGAGLVLLIEKRSVEE